MVSIDSYVVDGASCADKKEGKAAKQVEEEGETTDEAVEDSDAEEASDDEDTRAAKREI